MPVNLCPEKGLHIVRSDDFSGGTNPCWPEGRSLKMMTSNRYCGIVNSLRLIPLWGKWVTQSGPIRLLCSPFRTRNLGPTLEAFPHLSAILRRRQQMPAQSKMLDNGSISRQKSLGVTR
jgi:hypothetical protein